MAKSLFSLLGARQSSILSGATVLMLTVFASKFLGLVRDRLLVHIFTTSDTTIFFAAFKLPDLLFQLLIFGALSVAFIPIFTEHLHRTGEKEAFEFAANILNLCLMLFGVVAILAFIFVSPLNSLLVPGITGLEKSTTDQLTRIMLLGQVLLVIGSFFVGVAQSYQRFIVPSLAPLFYNLGVIIGIGVLSPSFGIMGPGLGVIIGAGLHVLVQLPLINSLGFRYSLSLSFLNQGVREVVKMMSIRNLGLAAEQINDAVMFALSTLISTSAPTLLTFAQHLQVVPIGLFGATIAQAALPVLSREQTQGEHENFKFTILTTMHQILFLTLPAAIFLIVLRIPVVRLVFGASQFTWPDTKLTGYTLMFLSIGLAFQSVCLLFVRGFYALKDTKTPVISSLVTVAVNISLSVFFTTIMHLDVWSLGLAYSLSNFLSFGLLLYFLDRKVGGFNPDDLIMPAFKMTCAALLSGLALYIGMKSIDKVVLDTTHTINLILLTGIASVFGLVIYLFFIWVFQVKEIYIFADALKRIYRMQFPVKSKEMLAENPVDQL